jgi:uncharacterized cupredoxin-like copper-binding protein
MNSWRTLARLRVALLFAPSVLVAQPAAPVQRVAVASPPATSAVSAGRLTVNAARRTARITLIAGSAKGSQPELNFNGTANGELELRVPKGWTVELLVENIGTATHSVRAVDDRELAVQIGPAAFRGAQSQHAEKGAAPGSTHTVTFVADRVGRFRIACAVLAHGFSGMWVRLTVDARATEPSLVEHSAVQTTH